MPGEAPSLAQLIDSRTREGELWEPLADGRLRCYACGHRCVIPPGQRGICKVRYNTGGRLLVPWGYVAGLQLDPIEKKPFFHAYPGSKALSFGMLGCDLHCAYCFSGDTPVLTPSGVVSIKAIFDAAHDPTPIMGGVVRFPQELRVVTATGNLASASKVFRHSYRGPMSVIKAMYLPAIRCTPDHRWLATTDPSGQGVAEVPAQELTPNHFVLVPKAVGFGNRITLDVADVLRNVTATFSTPRSLTLAEVGSIMEASEHGESSRVIGARLGKDPSYVRHVRSKVRRGRWVYEATQGIAIGSHFLIPIVSVTAEPFEGDVYNLEVEGEHSYVAGFCAVKNCQNALTSQALRDPAMGVPPQDVTPEQVVALAQRSGARVLTSTYNEPLITSEWAVHIFRAAKSAGLVCSYVSNGNATAEVLDYIRPYVDLYKVD
ncbi:MAG TPA: hypothetical protein VGW35_18560, partial [Methylomirabilota bacterium]|nr:hypothetical protein [Methylomirabilota bacterium]